MHASGSEVRKVQPAAKLHEYYCWHTNTTHTHILGAWLSHTSMARFGFQLLWLLLDVTSAAREEMKSLCTRCSYTSIKNCRRWGDPALTESWLCHQSLTIDHRYVSARFDRIISSTIWESGWPFVFTHRSSSSRASSCCSLLSRERLDFHCSRLWQTRVEDTEDERNMIHPVYSITWMNAWSCLQCRRLFDPGPDSLALCLPVSVYCVCERGRQSSQCRSNNAMIAVLLDQCVTIHASLTNECHKHRKRKKKHHIKYFNTYMEY